MQDERWMSLCESAFTEACLTSSICTHGSPSLMLSLSPINILFTPNTHPQTHTMELNNKEQEERGRNRMGNCQ